MHSLTIFCSIAIFLFSLNNIHCEKDIIDINTLQQIINHMSEAQKETIFQSLIQNSNQGRQDNSNWCCSIDPGVEASAKTRQTTYYVERHARNKCGYDGCGVFGWSRCTRWCDNYWNELQHGVETYTVYQARLCPPSNLVCCAGYITVINHCFTYQEILNNKDVLEILVSMGIPINPTMG